jgi:hypothetical protein
MHPSQFDNRDRNAAVRRTGRRVTIEHDIDRLAGMSPTAFSELQANQSEESSKVNRAKAIFEDASSSGGTSTPTRSLGLLGAAGQSKRRL